MSRMYVTGVIKEQHVF